MTFRDKVICSARTTTSTRKDVVNNLPESTKAVNSKRGQRVRRRLFDDINCEGSNNWASSQLQLIEEVESTTLGYDFRNECPIVNGHGSDYIFEAVDEREVPSFYRTKTSSLNRRERIAPPSMLQSPRKRASPFVVVLPVHDSVAYNTRSHDIITFGNNSSLSSSRCRCLRHDIGDPHCNNRASDKCSKLCQQNAAVSRKRTMKQQTLPEYLPVVRCKRQQSIGKKSNGSGACSEKKDFTPSFGTCKVEEHSAASLVGNTGSLKVKSCAFDNRRITRSMCA
uniref:Cyclin-dependent kinase inhibitor domain-containing protein n=1 Tax=Syphacia muris TaxID=451379 RepID=A0A0N5AZZ7_9BILA